MTQIYELNKLKEIIATNTNPRSVSMLYGNHTCKFFDDLKTARQEIFSIDPEKLKNVEMVSYGSKHFYRKLYTSETIFKEQTLAWLQSLEELPNEQNTKVISSYIMEVLPQIVHKLEKFESEMIYQKSLLYNLIECENIASGTSKPDKYEKGKALPALNAVNELKKQKDRLEEQVQQVQEIESLKMQLELKKLELELSLAETCKLKIMSDFDATIMRESKAKDNLDLFKRNNI